ncbi:MAG: NADH:flavin oxidoreductase [Rhodocyclaceae bacterium]|nr:NADH:flavin oxidoreductase [Rhodocyclaceae bacterium]
MPDRPTGLFSPIRIGALELPARLFKTATAETRADAAGRVTDAVVDFYRLLAKGGTPLIITGNLYVTRQGKSAPRQLGVDDDDKVAGLRRVTDMVHGHGGRIFAQLNHCGRQVVPDFVGAPEVVSASGVTDLLTGTRPRALGADEIAALVTAFADAAGRCQAAGFDGVQLHSANGYLLSQFLTPYTNRRGDAYGGDLENRTRIHREIVAAIRTRCGEAFPVIVKMNGADRLPLRAGLDTVALVAIARRLEAAGVDAVEITVGHYESGFPMVCGSFGLCLRHMVEGSMAQLPWLRRNAMRLFRPLVAWVCDRLWPGREGFNLDYAPAFARALTIPVICVGGFRTRAAMEGAIAGGQCDAVSAGRPFIADPFLFRHLRDGQAGPACVDCNGCVGHLGAQPADCYHPQVGAAKRAMLAREDAD